MPPGSLNVGDVHPRGTVQRTPLRRVTRREYDSSLMAELWREFEKLVSRIEGLLCPAGALVRSPDHLPKVTGKGTREVDASIRFSLGSTKLLVTVECRRRSHKQDVTWIEQLATKKRNVGATSTLAVSATEFSEEALEVARREGIETRVLSQVTDDNIRALTAEQLIVNAHGMTFTLGHVAPSYYDSSGDVGLDEKTLELVREKGWDAPVFIEQPSGSAHSLVDLIGKALPAEAKREPIGHNSNALVPPGAEVSILCNEPLCRLAQGLTPGVMNTFQINLGQGQYLIGTTAGPRNLKSFAFEVTATSQPEQAVPIDRLVQYSGGDHGTGVFAERRMVLGGDEIILTSHSPTPTSRTQVTITRQPVSQSSPGPVRRRR